MARVVDNAAVVHSVASTHPDVNAELSKLASEERSELQHHGHTASGGTSMAV
jgi:hypothetical protein